MIDYNRFKTCFKEFASIILEKKLDTDVYIKRVTMLQTLALDDVRQDGINFFEKYVQVMLDQAESMEQNHKLSMHRYLENVTYVLNTAKLNDENINTYINSFVEDKLKETAYMKYFTSRLELERSASQIKNICSLQ